LDIKNLSKWFHPEINVTVVKDAVAEVFPDKLEETWEEYKSNGVDLITTQEYFDDYTGF
jgi:hypothetical protein